MRKNRRANRKRMGKDNKSRSSAAHNPVALHPKLETGSADGAGIGSRTPPMAKHSPDANEVSSDTISTAYSAHIEPTEEETTTLLDQLDDFEPWNVAVLLKAARRDADTLKPFLSQNAPAQWGQLQPLLSKMTQWNKLSYEKAHKELAPDIYGEEDWARFQESGERVWADLQGWILTKLNSDLKGMQEYCQKAYESVHTSDSNALPWETFDALCCACLVPLEVALVGCGKDSREPNDARHQLLSKWVELEHDDPEECVPTLPETFKLNEQSLLGTIDNTRGREIIDWHALFYFFGAKAQPHLGKGILFEYRLKLNGNYTKKWLTPLDTTYVAPKEDSDDEYEDESTRADFQAFFIIEDKDGNPKFAGLQLGYIEYCSHSGKWSESNIAVALRGVGTINPGQYPQHRLPCRSLGRDGLCVINPFAFEDLNNKDTASEEKAILDDLQLHTVLWRGALPEHRKDCGPTITLGKFVSYRADANYGGLLRLGSN
ncbi:hypothetical protein BU26DRAFT_558984 [Trematosphaeria pertusa]|uniref:Uncharacterized protein n=1 Tax=Trematosphaeria pertusa TaxID=390896 RepID=A0A6A6IUP3_9PLEO|nr:uncharacterized protein BU26DRAFT_558984 [Trematosphaeria pertusa]KAF2254285.1 hypothetical protein BU26DRAFT_558984 [Trematosphaeria pertusa]